MTNFIYALKCPTTGEIRYIGKTVNPTKRLIAHRHRAKGEMSHRACWIHSLLGKGLQPILEIIDEAPFEHWPQIEVAYIEFFLEQGCDLTNGTPGGEDPPTGCWKGRKHTPEANEKNRLAHLGKPSPNKGKSPSIETRAKISASLLGEKNPNFRKERSPEYRANISIAKLGEKNPQFGKVRPPEHCAKISAGNIRRWERYRKQKEII